MDGCFTQNLESEELEEGNFVLALQYVSKWVHPVVTGVIEWTTYKIKLRISIKFSVWVQWNLNHCRSLKLEYVNWKSYH